MNELSIESIKDLEFNILKYIDSVCNENNIKYYLAYGTLLGAIRHKGFIPWDDDIDIVMPRDDYDRFLKILHQSPDTRYKLLEPGVNGYYYEFSKVSDSHTKVKQIYVDDIDMGLWVDVFPLDGVRNNWIRNKCLYFLHRCRVASVYANLPQSNPLLRPIIYVFWKVCRLIGWKFFLEKQLVRSIEYKYTETGYVGFKTSGMKKAEILPVEWFSDSVPVEFEGQYFPAPKEYGKYLEALYGDYMTLPPIEKRIPHKTLAYKKQICL